MKQVRFFVLKSDGYKSTGRAVLRNGEVQFEGVPQRQLITLDTGMTDPSYFRNPSRMWFPSDGLPFLELLASRFRGSYFKATLVEEVEE